MYKYRMHLMYDGTNYSGWQVQPNATSIQEIVKRSVATIIKKEVSVVGSGRTDAGVHALDQVAHFQCNDKLDLEKFLRSMNGILPVDIRLTHISEVDAHFHAQKSARKKEYHYVLCCAPFIPPFKRLYCMHMRQALDIELLKKACRHFVGTHDFSAFANKATTGAAKKNPVRTLYRLDVVEWEYGIRLEFEGNGFLYKMVRNIVGMLLAVSTKKRAIDEIDQIFKEKNRRLAPQAAPAHGLFLVRVSY